MFLDVPTECALSTERERGLAIPAIIERETGTEGFVRYANTITWKISEVDDTMHRMQEGKFTTMSCGVRIVRDKFDLALDNRVKSNRSDISGLFRKQ